MFLNPFYVTGLFLYPLKISFRVYGKKPAEWNHLITLSQNFVEVLGMLRFKMRCFIFARSAFVQRKNWRGLALITVVSKGPRKSGDVFISFEVYISAFSLSYIQDPDVWCEKLFISLTGLNQNIRFEINLCRKFAVCFAVEWLPWDFPISLTTSVLILSRHVMTISFGSYAYLSHKYVDVVMNKFLSLMQHFG